jgi:hypothetical protein
MVTGSGPVSAAPDRGRNEEKDDSDPDLVHALLQRSHSKFSKE